MYDDIKIKVINSIVNNNESSIRNLTIKDTVNIINTIFDSITEDYDIIRAPNKVTKELLDRLNSGDEQQTIAEDLGMSISKFTGIMRGHHIRREYVYKPNNRNND